MSIERPAPTRATTDGERAFRAVLALCPDAAGAAGIAADAAGRTRFVAPDDAGCLLVRGARGWQAAPQASPESRAVCDLYLPLRGGAGVQTVAHLGQSLDGQIATASGDSYYVTGPANLLHLQRMRALCDAVVVGAGTVAADDPRLTVRLDTGRQPVRVVLDPRRRLGAAHRVFSDGAAPTLLIVHEALAKAGERHGQAEVVGVPVRGARLALDALLDVLHRRGLNAVFVEGGGATVSRFLEAGLLDRLQIAIAPLVIGAGRPGLALPSRARIGDCLRAAHRIFRMGDDVLVDCDLRTPPQVGAAGAEVLRVL